MQTAAADLDAIAHRLQKENPQGIFPDKFSIVPETLLDSFIGGFRKTLYALLTAVLLLLLIACSNVANLLLLRATVREREIVMRATLGASRFRLISNCLRRVLCSLQLPPSQAVCWHTCFESCCGADSCRHPPRGGPDSHERAHTFRSLGPHSLNDGLKWSCSSSPYYER